MASSTLSIRLLSGRCVLVRSSTSHRPLSNTLLWRTSSLISETCSTTRSFSTQPRMSLPPNLKIDPRSTCSPFYGMPLQKENTPTDDEVEDDDIDESESQLALSSKDDDEYYAIPLPDRLHVDIFDFKDSQAPVGTIWLDEQVFGHDEIRVDLLQRAVVYYRNKRRGRRKAITKTISEVSGSGRKVRPQKGQGAARAGHSRPAHWRGGAKAHGPKGSIQNYANCKLNKKVKRLALMHGLSQKLKEGNLILVNDFGVSDDENSYKTKHLANALHKQWDIAHRNHGATALLVDYVTEKETSVANMPASLLVASRNLYKVKVLNPKQVNVYDLLKFEKLFLTLSALGAMEDRLMKKPTKEVIAATGE